MMGGGVLFWALLFRELIPWLQGIWKDWLLFSFVTDFGSRGGSSILA
jgi:hypothetical protein